jgi:hypothetical protein
MISDEVFVDQHVVDTTKCLMLKYSSIGTTIC